MGEKRRRRSPEGSIYGIIDRMDSEIINAQNSLEAERIAHKEQIQHLESDIKYLKDCLYAERFVKAQMMIELENLKKTLNLVNSEMDNIRSIAWTVQQDINKRSIGL